MDLAALAPSADLSGISRRHLTLSISGGHLVAIDVGSTNGTVHVQRKDEYRLITDRPTPLFRSDTLRLPGGVELRPSGRRFPTLSRLPSARKASAGGGTVRRDIGPNSC